MAPSNRVLTEDASTSDNLCQSDQLLQAYLEKYIDDDALKYMQPRLDRWGGQAAGPKETLSWQADKHGPTLKKRNKLGETINKVDFHPAYWELMKIAAQ